MEKLLMQASLLVMTNCSNEVSFILIDQEVAEWINQEEPGHGEETNEYGKFLNVSCSESVKRKIWEREFQENEGQMEPFEDYEIYLDPTYWFNDKLKHVWPLVINGKEALFFKVKEMLEFVKRHNIDIIYEYHGAY